MMPLKNQLLHVANTYALAAKARGRNGQISLTVVGSRVFGDSKTFARIETGGDVTTANFERAMLWFSQNWPDGASWPDGVERPKPDHSPPSDAAA